MPDLMERVQIELTQMGLVDRLVCLEDTHVSYSCIILSDTDVSYSLSKQR